MGSSISLLSGYLGLFDRYGISDGSVVGVRSDQGQLLLYTYWNRRWDSAVQEATISYQDSAAWCFDVVVTIPYTSHSFVLVL